MFPPIQLKISFKKKNKYEIPLILTLSFLSLTLQGTKTESSLFKKKCQLILRKNYWDKRFFLILSVILQEHIHNLFCLYIYFFQWSAVLGMRI